MRDPRKKKLLVAFAVAALVLAAAELGFRLLEPALGVDRARLEALREYVCEGRPGKFEARPHTVFGRPRNTAISNSLGFSDEEWALEKTAGVARIACLGASTTEGGHPRYLGELLEERTGRRFEVMNCGISGWTSAETLVAWFLLLQDYRPDLVVIHLASNDVEPRNRTDFRADYTHFRHDWETPRFNALHRLLARWSDLYAALLLRAELPNVVQFTTHAPSARAADGDGRLPPGTAVPFRRNLASIGRSAARNGARVLLLTMPYRPVTEPEGPFERTLRAGIAEHNAILRELAEAEGWLLADGEAAFARDPASPGWFVDIVHLSPPGKEAKARVVADALESGWPPARPQER